MVRKPLYHQLFLSREVPTALAGLVNHMMLGARLCQLGRVGGGGGGGGGGGHWGHVPSPTNSDVM